MEEAPRAGGDRPGGLAAGARRCRCRRRRSRRSLAAFAARERPLVVTSYLGRRPEAVAELVRFCEALGAGVLESVPSRDELPARPSALPGNQWNDPRQNQALAEADCVLVIDSDVPWIPTVSRPAAGAAIFHVDVDPLKEAMPLWYIGARRSLRADAATALGQLDAAARRPSRSTRRWLRRADGALCGRERARGGRSWRRGRRRRSGAITPEFVTACVRRQLGRGCARAERGHHQLRRWSATTWR